MAPGGPPGGGGRGRGGKFKKFTRGGGKHFSRDLRPLDADGNEIGMWGDAKKGDDDDDDDEEEESSSEEEEEEKAAMTREERRAAAKARKEAAKKKAAGSAQPGDLPPDSSEEEDSDDDMPANPNHSQAARKQAAAGPVSVDEATDGVKNMSVKGGKSKPVGELSRREREALQAQQARERYQKLHEQGKTDEAKADLARLKLIREKREAEAARKQAEKEEREAQESSKKSEIEAREARRREAAMGSASGAKKGKGKK